MDGECQLHKNTERQFSVGQVDFINCLPINFPFVEAVHELPIQVKITNDVPSQLNKLILNNEIDIAPVSSVAYLENKDKLVLIEDLCIASDGPADSVLLFSKFPIEELNGASIALSNASATSNKLLQIILKDFYNLSNTFEILNPHSSVLNNNYSAKLLIGDDALLEYSQHPRDIFIYDLGSLWKKHTGLPMVFALWVRRKNISERENEKMNLISYLLKKSKELGLSTMLDKVIKKAQGKILLPAEFYKGYFGHLTYDLTDEVKKGLELFNNHLHFSKKAKVLSN